MKMVRDFIRRLAGIDPKKARAEAERRERQTERLNQLRDIRAARLSAASAELQRSLHEMKREAERV